MYPENIEKIIKAKYANEQVDIDHNALWTRVYPEIKKEKKRPVYLWLLSSFLIGSLLTILSLSFSKKETTELQVTNKPVKVDFVQEESIEAKQQIANLEESQNDVILISENLEKQSNDLLSDEKAAVVNKQYKDLNSIEQISERTSDFGTVAVSDRMQFEQRKVVLGEVNKPQQSADQGILLQGLPLLSSLGLNFDAAPKLRLLTTVENLQDIADPYKKNRKISLDVLIGYGLASQNLRAFNIADDNLVKARSNSEKALDAMSLSLLMNVRLNNSWYVRTGLGYQMITDKARHIFEQSKIVNGDSVIVGTSEDRDGVVTNFYGVGQEQEVTTTTKNRYNSYHSIGVPLELVHSREIGSLELSVGFGLNIAYSFFNEGYLQYRVGEEYDLGIDPDGFFKSKFHSDLLTDLGILYHFDKRYAWTTNLQYSYGLSGFNSGINPIEQKYNLLKINTGLRYQF